MAGREKRPVSEVRAEKAFQAKFQQTARSHGMAKAIADMDAMNARKRESDNRARMNAMEGMASNTTLGGTKFGWTPARSKTIGRRTQTSYHGDYKVERVWQDGELISEQRIPI